MTKRLVFASTLFLVSFFGRPVPAVAADPAWFSLLGSDPVFQDRMRALLRSQASAVDRLTMPDPTVDPLLQDPHGVWQSMADALSAYVNIYKISGDQSYAVQAKRIADWFVAWNDYLVAHRDPTIPYLGWGVATREGYYNRTCAAGQGFTVLNSRGDYLVDHFRADEAWDSAAAVRGLIKYSEIDPDGTASVHFQHARSILDNWPVSDHASNDGNPFTPDLVNDGPYAAAGLRWVKKSNEPCEIRYVKNTTIVMGEQFFRAYALTQEPRYLQAGIVILNAQLWDVVTHLNFGYNSYMTRVDRSNDVYGRITQDDELNKIDHLPDGSIVCKAANVSCWNHLGFEGYDMYLMQQLTKGLPSNVFPVPGTQADLGQAISQTITTWRTSQFGDPDRYPWTNPPAGASPTHVTAYNCALRFSDDASYLNACVTALGHAPSGSTVFYSLVPDTIVNQLP
jgi:hypothetical protein